MTYAECKIIVDELLSCCSGDFFSGGTLKVVQDQLINLTISVNDLNERVNILEVGLA